MNIETLSGIIIASVLPMILTIIFILLDEKTKFNSLNKNLKQAIYGIAFGGLAVLGTEFGVPFNGAQTNVRDAAVLTAGLMFGAPAGIIAGLIGGIERYFAVYWGVGTYTRIACTVSTILAGFYSAGLRKHIFDNERPSWSLALLTGTVIEVFHMTMVFLTNMNDTEHAMEIVKTCSIIMIPANSISTMLSAIASSLTTKVKVNASENRSVTYDIQKWLLLSVVLAFVITSMFTFRMQTSISDEQVKMQLNGALDDLASDVEDMSAKNLLNLAYQVRSFVNKKSLQEMSEEFDVSEISVVDENGIITDSTNADFIGFDFSQGEQSKEFLCLLKDKVEYVQDYGPISYDNSIYRKYAGVATRNGFIQVGYGAEEFHDDIADTVKISANNKHIGNTGYIVIADKNLDVVSSPSDHRYNRIPDYGFDPNQEPGVVFNRIVDGEECMCLYKEAEGYFFVSVIPTSEAYKTRNVAMWVNSFMEILVFSMMFGLIYLLIKEQIIKKINEVNKSLDKITEGNLDEIVNVNSSSEFISLSKDINQTVDKLKEYIAEANARIDSELEYAKNIQDSALPHVFPESNHFEIYALMDAAKEVGGDFYDFLRTSSKKLNFLIADVSGKGIPGAMFMMRAKSELHSLTETGIAVNDVFTYGNNSLCEGNETGMFVTAWEGCLDFETGIVNYANAGHNPPVLIHNDGTCEYIRGKAGFVLAGMDGIQYKQQELQMKQGEVLFLYTDGVVEATNCNNELFGEDRLINCLKNIDRNVDMEYLCCEVIGEVGRFVGDNEQFDDITMLAIRYKGNHKEA